jgi:hypothetical protein
MTALMRSLLLLDALQYNDLRKPVLSLAPIAGKKAAKMVFDQ